MHIALYTDEICMANVISYFFKDIPCTVYSRNELEVTKKNSSTHIILGVSMLEGDDWIRLRHAIGLGIETYLMIGEPITVSEAHQAREIGVTNILIDPIFYLVRNITKTPENLFSILMYPGLQMDTKGFSELIYIGSNTYFHPKQYWVKYENTKIDLTEKESSLLLFFLEHEGQIITKHALANQLWGGFIQPDGIHKVVSRLKKKLGPARDLISSRQLGGFLYLRNKSI